METSQRLLSEQEAAPILRKSVSSMQFDRFKKRGPKYIKYRGRVFYRMQDLMEYIESCLVVPENNPKPVLITPTEK